PLGRIDASRLERLENLRARQGLGRAPELADHVAAEAGDAHLQATEVLHRADLALEPAAHLVAGLAGEEGDDAEAPRKLLPKLLAAAVVDPAQQLRAGHPHGHGGEEVEAAVLALPVVFRAVVE